MPIAPKKSRCCPIARSLAVLSERWKAIVVWHLLSGRKRYSDLLNLAAVVPEHILTQVLRPLAIDGGIQKTDAH
ncbi:winged helix-turn-helix transcriptional regulator [Acidisarcina polymorpha]|uniref:winged helix-turn-helix transcriptional regulator n=1 Tax=Acidisarcina polymorpha TaxID=2211140 RepID=UPI000DEEBA90